MKQAPSAAPPVSFPLHSNAAAPAAADGPRQPVCPPVASGVDKSPASTKVTVVHRCRFCSYTSGVASSVAVHERRHTGERPYTCSYCNYAAAQRKQVVAHERSHHPARAGAGVKLGRVPVSPSRRVVEDSKLGAGAPDAGVACGSCGSSGTTTNECGRCGVASADAAPSRPTKVQRGGEESGLAIVSSAAETRRGQAHALAGSPEPHTERDSRPDAAPADVCTPSSKLEVKASSGGQQAGLSAGKLEIDVATPTGQADLNFDDAMIGANGVPLSVPGGSLTRAIPRNTDAEARRRSGDGSDSAALPSPRCSSIQALISGGQGVCPVAEAAECGALGDASAIPPPSSTGDGVFSCRFCTYTCSVAASVSSFCIAPGIAVRPFFRRFLLLLYYLCRHDPFGFRLFFRLPCRLSCTNAFTPMKSGSRAPIRVARMLQFGVGRWVPGPGPRTTSLGWFCGRFSRRQSFTPMTLAVIIFVVPPTFNDLACVHSCCR